MVNDVFYSEDARLEIHKAKCYFELKGKSDAFLDDLFKQEDLIRAMPEMFQIKYKNFRIVNLEKFDFAIHYTYDSKTNLIYVYRVLRKNEEY